MPLLIRYKPQGMTSDQYRTVGERLEAIQQWPPDGLIAHVGFGPEGNLHVSEVWESDEQLRAFQEKLMPILQEVGIDVRSNEPETLEVHGVESRQFSTNA